ncbi:MAG TPA: portal protein [Caulobacter sp.]|nr:portal protein [Caulobacter sp.]
MTELRVKSVLRHWDLLKQARMPHESQWQEVVDYFMPKSSAMLKPGPNELRSRRVTSSVPQTALARSAALVMGWSVDPTQPFLGANVERGLAMAGRRLRLGAEALDYLQDLEWQVFDRMMLPQSGFMESASRITLELVGFGTAVQWIGRRQGFGPRFSSRPLRACWIEVNQDGEVDTLFYGFRLPAWRCAEIYPEAAKVDGIAKLLADEKKEATDVELIHVVRPRRGGERGAIATRKPFEELVVAWEHKAIVQERGYDSFPFQVPRISPETDSPYGVGRAWRTLPDAKAYNVLQEAVEMAVELRVLPPVMTPTNIFGGPMDRRPGAVNEFDTAALGFMSAKEAFQVLNLGGDPFVGAEWMDRLAGNIERGLDVDWMRMLANPNMTATQTLEIRDQQIRLLSSLVPGIDRGWFGLGADRMLEIMVESRMVRQPPDELAGQDVDWDYRGPLAIAQRRGQFETVQRLLALQEMAAKADPTQPGVVAMEEAFRGAADALGAAPGMLKTREAYAAEVEARAQQAQAAETDRQAMAATTALRDGAQGLASLAGIGGGTITAQAA